MAEDNIFPKEYDELWNSYFYDDKKTFKNKLNITNYDELEKKDAELSFNRLVELYENPIDGNFDKAHLCNIHRYLFQDLYDWAGEYRKIYMAKNHSYFAETSEIDTSLEYELSLMNEEVKEIHGIDMFASFLADYYVVLLNIHPFRDGNGRTIREFLREFTYVKTRELGIGEYELDWSLVDSEALYNAMPNARMIKSPIETEFRKALVGERYTRRM